MVIQFVIQIIAVLSPITIIIIIIVISNKRISIGTGMKDRWKIFWTCIALAIVIGIIVGTLTASFKKVELREYGILYYTIFSRVDNQTARANGNYLVGLDYDFHKFPSGIILVQFNTMALTKDMSMVEIEGLFTGRLIMTEVTPMYENYGYEYLQFLKASIEEYVRQSIESYSLSELITNRQGAQNNVKGLVCLKIQTEYSWIQCDYVSLGRVGTNVPEPSILEMEQSFELKKIQLLGKEIEGQKLLNFYTSGGFQILRGMGASDSKLFVDVANLLSGALGAYPLAEKVAAAQYCLLSAKFPAINNTLSLKF